MHRFVFVESSCLVDTWSMAKEFVLCAIREAGGVDRAGAVRVLDAEVARGTDLVSVHRALWGLLDGHEYRTLAALSARRTTGCIERVDPLGRAAFHVVRGHLAAGDTVVVVSELLPVFVQPLARHLGVDRVVCGTSSVDAGGRLSGGFPDILLGASAGAAAELVARQASVPHARRVAYGRVPRDRELLRVVGHAVRIGYDGVLHPSPRTLVDAMPENTATLTTVGAGLRCWPYELGADPSLSRSVAS